VHTQTSSRGTAVGINCYGSFERNKQGLEKLHHFCGWSILDNWWLATHIVLSYYVGNLVAVYKFMMLKFTTPAKVTLFDTRSMSYVGIVTGIIQSARTATSICTTFHSQSTEKERKKRTSFKKQICNRYCSCSCSYSCFAAILYIHSH